VVVVFLVVVLVARAHLDFSLLSDFSSLHSVASFNEISTADWENSAFGISSGLALWEGILSASVSGIFSAVNTSSSVRSIAPGKFFSSFGLVFFVLSVSLITVSSKLNLSHFGSRQFVASLDKVSSADWEDSAFSISSGLALWEGILSASVSGIFFAVNTWDLSFGWWN